MWLKNVLVLFERKNYTDLDVNQCGPETLSQNKNDLYFSKDNQWTTDKLVDHKLFLTFCFTVSSSTV